MYDKEANPRTDSSFFLRSIMLFNRLASSIASFAPVRYAKANSFLSSGDNEARKTLKRLSYSAFSSFVFTLAKSAFHFFNSTFASMIVVFLVVMKW